MWLWSGSDIEILFSLILEQTTTIQGVAVAAKIITATINQT